MEKGEGGSHNPNQEPKDQGKTYRWNQRRGESFYRKLKPGDIVVGFDSLEEVDRFASKAGDFLSHRRTAIVQKERSLRAVGNLVNTNRKGTKLSETLRPKGFFGELRDPRVVITPTDLDVVRTGREPIRPEDAMSFAVVADMFSTGRGIIGRSGRVCTVFLRESTYPNDLIAYKSTKKLISADGENFTRLLQKEIRLSHYASVLDSLARIAQGGSPGLGKRS